MESGEILNQAVATIITILRGGYDRLSTELQELMSMLIGIQLMLTAVAWGVNALRIFMGILWSMLMTALWAMLFFSYVFMTQAFIDYCIWAGLEIGGTVSSGQVTVQEFQKPSTMIEKGFIAVIPIKDFIQSHTGLGMLYNFFTLLFYFGAWMVIQTVFTFLGLYLAFALIMLYFTTAYALPFIAWGVLSQTAFLAERGASLFIASAARIGATALAVGFIFPYTESYFLPDAPNPDAAGAVWLSIFTCFLAGMVVIGSSAVHAILAGGRVFSFLNLVPGARALSSMRRAA
jgi:type IV secretion system protein TrbL